MGFSLVQSQAGHSISSTTLTLTVSPTGLYNLVVISFYVSNPGQVVSVTDNKGNVYVAAVSEVNSSNGAAANKYHGVQTTAGATSITVTLSTNQDLTAALNEYLGGQTTNALVFDKAATNTNTGSSSSVSLSPSASGELIDAGLLIFNASAGPSAGANYTAGGLDQSNHTAFSQYRLAGTTFETAPISWSGGSLVWVEIASAYIPLPPTGFLMYNNVGMGR